MYDVLGKRKSAASLTAVFTIIDPVDVAGMTDLLLYRFCSETPLSAIYYHRLAFRDRVNVFDRRCRSTREPGVPRGALALGYRGRRIARNRRHSLDVQEQAFTS